MDWEIPELDLTPLEVDWEAIELYWASIDWEAIDRTIGEIELPGEFTLKNDSI